MNKTLFIWRKYQKRSVFILLKILNDNIEKLIKMLEKSNLEDIALFLGSKKRMFFSNFFAGIFRGVGFSIGFSIITAIVVIILQKIVLLNIPVIGEYVSDIVDFLKTNQG